MLQVVSAISGEDLVVLNTEELEGRESSKSEALKAQLAEIVGVSRFRLRLFREDNSGIQGDDEITEKMLKLVILGGSCHFVKTSMKKNGFLLVEMMMLKAFKDSWMGL